MSESMSHEMTGEQLKGLGAFWAMMVVGGVMIAVAAGQWGLFGDVPVSEIGWVAIGSANAIGLVAIGGWNAIGLIAIGGANSIGVVTIGGLNSMGLVSFGGVNSVGLMAWGGLNAWGYILGVRTLVFAPAVTSGEHGGEAPGVGCVADAPWARKHLRRGQDVSGSRCVKIVALEMPGWSASVKAGGA